MRMLGKYIKLHRKVVVVYFLFALIFTALFAMWKLPVAPVLYGTALGMFAAVIIWFRDYMDFCRKHRELSSLVEEIKITDSHFPRADGLIEHDYQAVLRSIYEDRQQITNQMNYQYRDMMEYYTTWVHQIKTPIAAMRLQLQGEDSERSRELLEELQRIEQYVEMVLTYLRLDSGSTDYVLKNYDLDDIVRQAVRKYASQFIRKRIRLIYGSLSCQVLTDEKWLEFVLEQILSNAIKYTKRGSVAIYMDEQAEKTLVIADTGIGIAAEDIPRVFEKGYTGGNGRYEKSSTGIGLYLCRRALKRLSHTIRIESELGQGTRIYINLETVHLDSD